MRLVKRSAPVSSEPEKITEDHWAAVSGKINSLTKTLQWLVRLIVGIAVALLVTMFFIMDQNTLNNLTACTMG